MRTFQRIRRTIAAVLLVVYLPGCYHWVTEKQISPQEYITTKHPKQVRLQLVDSTRRTVLRQPWVSADSIGGWPLISKGWEIKPGSPWAAALSNVQQMEVRKVNRTGTTFAIVGSFLLIGAGVAIAVLLANYEGS